MLQDMNQPMDKEAEDDNAPPIVTTKLPDLVHQMNEE